MGKYVRGTTVTLELTTVNMSTRQKIDVSAVSCYIERNDTTIVSLNVSHVTTGWYRAHWQTSKDTDLGKYEYKFVYKYQGTRMKRGTCEIVR